MDSWLMETETGWTFLQTHVGRIEMSEDIDVGYECEACEDLDVEGKDNCDVCDGEGWVLDDEDSRVILERVDQLKYLAGGHQD